MGRQNKALTGQSSQHRFQTENGEGYAEMPARQVFAVLVSLCLISAAVRFLAAVPLNHPSIFVDELAYWKMAQSFFHQEKFLVFGAYYDSPAIVYPIVLSTLFLSKSLSTSYLAAQAVNSCFISAVVFPAYMLAKEFTECNRALAVAVLSVAIPGAAYSAKIMAEGLFYPVFILSFFLAYKTLITKQLKFALLTGLMFVIGYYTKPIMLFLMSSYGICVAVLTIFEIKWFCLSKFTSSVLKDVLMLIVPFFVFAVGLVYRFQSQNWHNLSIGTVLVSSSYAHTVQLGNAIIPFHLFFLSVAGLLIVLLISTGVVPVLRVFHMGSTFFELSKEKKIFWGLTMLSSLTYLFFVSRLVAQTEHAPRIFERYVFVLSPLYFILYFASDDRTHKRGLLKAAAVGLFLGAILFGVAASPYMNWNIPIDAPSLTFLFELAWHWGIFSVRMQMFVAAMAFLIGVATYTGTRRPLWATIWCSIFFLVLNAGWYQFQKQVINKDVDRFQKVALFINSLQPTATVAFIWDDLDPRVFWYSAFWNKASTQVYSLSASPPWYGRQIKTDASGDALEWPHSPPEYVVASTTMKLCYHLIKNFPAAKVAVYRVLDGNPGRSLRVFGRQRKTLIVHGR